MQIRLSRCIVKTLYEVAPVGQSALDVEDELSMLSTNVIHVGHILVGLGARFGARSLTGSLKGRQKGEKGKGKKERKRGNKRKRKNKKGRRRIREKLEM